MAKILIGFAHRLAYVRWLRDCGRVKRETDLELANHVGVGDKWLMKWKYRDDAPEGRIEYNALEKGLKPMGVSVAWLYDGIGAPPEPALWSIWFARLAPDAIPRAQRRKARYTRRPPPTTV